MSFPRKHFLESNTYHEWDWDELQNNIGNWYDPLIAAIQGNISTILGDYLTSAHTNSSTPHPNLTIDNVGQGITYKKPTATQVTNWDTAYGWGNWAHTTLAGYGITDAAPLSHKTTEDAINGLVFVNGAGAYSAKGIGSDVQAYDADLAAIAGIGVARGALITGQGVSPAWAKLVVGAAGKGLISDGTDIAWDYIISAVPTGLTYTNATRALSLTAGYVIPTTTEETNWNTVYNAFGGSPSMDNIPQGTAYKKLSAAEYAKFLTGFYDILDMGATVKLGQGRNITGFYFANGSQADGANIYGHDLFSRGYPVYVIVYASPWHYLAPMADTGNLPHALGYRPSFGLLQGAFSDPTGQPEDYIYTNSFTSHAINPITQPFAGWNNSNYKINNMSTQARYFQLLLFAYMGA
jgi:hypothetical protein